MPERLKVYYPTEPASRSLQMAYNILINAHKAAGSFLSQFESIRKQRDAHGTPNDEEQDLLRAMLIFSSSGLDSMVKQLVKDTLGEVIEIKEGANERFVEWVERQMMRDEDIDSNLLVSSLLSESPRKLLVQELIKDLTASSLQSAEQLFTVASYFDIPTETFTNDIYGLKNIFHIRNQISHEMDIDFEQLNRSRRPRGRDNMIDNTNELFRVGKVFLESVENILQQGN